LRTGAAREEVGQRSVVGLVESLDVEEKVD
jgi:hypothetical protein